MYFEQYCKNCGIETDFEYCEQCKYKRDNMEIGTIEKNKKAINGFYKIKIKCNLCRNEFYSLHSSRKACYDCKPLQS